MSIKATLLIIVLGLSSAVFALAGLQFQTALENRGIAQDRLNAVSSVQAFGKVADQSPAYVSQSATLLLASTFQARYHSSNRSSWSKLENNSWKRPTIPAYCVR